MFQLITSDDFSKELCVICNYQLTNCWQFRRNIVKSQSSLSKYVESTKRQRPEECEVLIIQENLKDECEINTDLVGNDPIEDANELDEAVSEFDNETFFEAEDAGNLQESKERRKLYGKLG